ncbi:hypothetical protein V2J09_005234 [Rumex salicifolius]
MHTSTTSDYQANKRVLRYLKGTLSHHLHFCPINVTSLLAYFDAGWISDSDDSHSWTSRKQRVIARSSIEAEYRALAYTSVKLLWIKQLLQDLHVHLLTCLLPSV